MRRMLAGVFFQLGLLLDGASGNPALGPEPVLGFPAEERHSQAMSWHLPRLARRFDAGDPSRDEIKVLGVLAEGIASHYLGSDDRRPVNPLTGGRVEPAAEPGYMVDGTAPTAAMKGVALGTKVRVTNVRSGKSVIVRINDRGPYRGRRVIDLTPRAFSAIADDPKQGLIKKVRVERVSDDTATTWPEIRLTVRDWAEIRRRGKKAFPAIAIPSPATMVAAVTPPAVIASMEPTRVSPDPVSVEPIQVAAAPVKAKQAPIVRNQSSPVIAGLPLKAFAAPSLEVERAGMGDLPAMVAALSANSVKKLVKRALTPGILGEKSSNTESLPSNMVERLPDRTPLLVNLVEKPSNPVLAPANPAQEAPARVVPAVVAQVPPAPPAPAAKARSVAQVPPVAPAAAVTKPARVPAKATSPSKRTPAKRAPAPVKRATAAPVPAPGPASGPAKPEAEPRPVMLAAVAAPAPRAARAKARPVVTKAATKYASKRSKTRRSSSGSSDEHTAATNLPIEVLLARAQAALSFEP